MLRQLPIWLLFVLPFAAFSQDKVVTGKVTDSKDGSPIAGISVSVSGTKRGTVTGADGSFKIGLPPGSSKLTFSGASFEKQEVNVGGQTEITVAMVAAANTQLDQVVVIGYGTARKKDLTGSVASLTPKSFNQGAINAPDQLLQNKIPGLEVTSNSGAPGSASTVKIRGNNSIRNSANPLYVVDGVPLDGRTARPSADLGANGLGFGTTPDDNPLLYIDPNTIAQIDVLKDASSSAIYGSRGANGVIVITTKKGGSGAPKLEVGSSIGIAGYMKKYGILSPSQFRSEIKTYHLDTLSNNTNPYDHGSSVDALDAISQNKISQNYSLAMSGGSETGHYRASFLASSTPGLLKKTSLDKYLATFNGQYKFLDNKLSLDFSFIAGHVLENATNVSNTAGSQGNLISAALNWNPTQAFRAANGQYNLNVNSVVNPLALQDAFSDAAIQDQILGNISLGYKLTKNLDYKFLYAINNGVGSRLINVEGFLTGLTNLSGLGYAVKANAAITSQTFTHTLNYRVDISKDFSMTALVGYEYWKTNYSSSNIAGTGFNTNLDQTQRIPIPYTSIFQNAKVQYPNFTSVDPTVELQSYFARVGFNYNDRYLITATLRDDGSSKFGANNKYGLFPSVGARWVLNNESFMKGSKVFNQLALRGSWGITGSQDYPAGASQEQFGLTAYNQAGQTIVANPSLKWEKTTSTNFGVDVSVLKGRISGSIDYYYKNTSNLIYQATAIQPAPSSVYYINLPANLINQGVEFAINAGIVDKKDFGWDANFNIAYNKNILKNFYDLNTGKALSIQTGSVSGQGVSGTLAQIITNDQPVDEFYLKKFNGFAADGSQKIDANPSYAGDPNPHVLIGFGTSFRYKKLSLAINAGGATGFMILNNTAISVTNISNLSSGRNIGSDLIGSPEALSSGAAASTRYLESGDYIKLRNATLRYAVGNVGKYVKGLSVFASGTNLFVITKFKGFDPEVNVDKSNNGYPSRSIEYIPYPTPRTFTLGLNFSL